MIVAGRRKSPSLGLEDASMSFQGCVLVGTKKRVLVADYNPLRCVRSHRLSVRLAEDFWASARYTKQWRSLTGLIVLESRLTLPPWAFRAARVGRSPTPAPPAVRLAMSSKLAVSIVRPKDNFVLSSRLSSSCACRILGSKIRIASFAFGFCKRVGLRATHNVTSSV